MAVVLPERKLIVVPTPTADDLCILEQIFEVRTFALPNGGGSVTALPHCLDSLTLLTNMGYPVDGCSLFESYYTPPVSSEGFTPWWWQMETASFFISNRRGFCTSTPRTGKTLSTLLGIDYLQQNGERAALICAPLTVAAEGEWAATCRNWFPGKRVVLVHGDREAALDEPADIYLINPDGIKLAQDKLATMVADGRITIGVIDELTDFANAQSQRWKAMNKVVTRLNYLWGLTGTPGGPEKVYAQVKLVSPTQVPHSFHAWRDKTMHKITQFKWVPSHGHEETIKLAMSPCIRFDKEQLMEIPTPEVISDYVELSPAQQRLTDMLTDDLRVLVDSQEIDAASASTLAQKLLQVSGGAVRTEEGIVRIDAAPKIDRLEYWLRKTPAKKVVFSSFTGVNNMLVDEIARMGFSVEKIDGGVTGTKRSQILKEFMEEGGPHVLVCHPRTTAFGVELAIADHIICYGTPLTGAFIYQQMFERLSSSKQKALNTYVIHLMAGRQDKVSFSGLSQGVNIGRKIVDIFTKELL